MLIPEHNSPRVQAANERLQEETRKAMEETAARLAKRQREAAAKFAQGYMDREHAFRMGAEWQELFPYGDIYLFPPREYSS